MRWVWLLPSQARVVTAVRPRASAPPEPTGSGTPLHTGYGHQDCAGNGTF